MSRTGNIGMPTGRKLLVRCHTIRSASDCVTRIIRKNAHVKIFEGENYSVSPNIFVGNVLLGRFHIQPS